MMKYLPVCVVLSEFSFSFKSIPTTVRTSLDPAKLYLKEESEVRHVPVTLMELLTCVRVCRISNP